MGCGQSKIGSIYSKNKKNKNNNAKNNDSIREYTIFYYKIIINEKQIFLSSLTHKLFHFISKFHFISNI